MQTTVSLKKIYFPAAHGYYSFEQLTGNQFVVSVACEFEKENGIFLDYEVLYRLTKDVMYDQGAEQFLETLANRLIDNIVKEYYFVKKIKIEITKTKPPIEGFNGEGASIKMKWKQ